MGLVFDELHISLPKEAIISDIRIAREVGRVSATLVLGVGNTIYEEDGTTVVLNEVGTRKFDIDYYLVKEIDFKEVFTMKFIGVHPLTGESGEYSFIDIDTWLCNILYPLVQVMLSTGQWSLKDMKVIKKGALSTGHGG